MTTLSPNDMEFPPSMADIKSETWIMTDLGLLHNGAKVREDYGKALNKLKARDPFFVYLFQILLFKLFKVGDRLAVVRKENGTLHFFVNSEDLV